MHMFAFTVMLTLFIDAIFSIKAKSIRGYRCRNYKMTANKFMLNDPKPELLEDWDPRYARAVPDKRTQLKSMLQSERNLYIPSL